MLAAIYASPAQWWPPRLLGRAAGQPHQAVYDELKLLWAAGLLERSGSAGSYRYRIRSDDPIALSLGDFVRQTRGSIPAVREILMTVDPEALAWLVRSSNVAELVSQREAARGELVVIATRPARAVAKAIASGLPRYVARVMSAREWVGRLRRGDLIARRLRRVAKYWIHGGPQALARLERSASAAHELLALAVADWREQLSDDWDEEWDPDLVPQIG